MQQIIEYIVGFFVLILAQVFIFDNVNIWGYVNPYIYIMFLIMLPMQIRHSTLLILGFVSGMTIDLLTGSAGLSAMVATFVAFVRPSILRITAGRDVINVGGIPSSTIFGNMQFVMYILLMMLCYNIPYFLIEVMNPSEILHTSIRIICSTIFTVVIIYAAHFLITGKRK